MRTTSQETVLRLKELLNIIAEKPATISEIVEKTSIPSPTTAHKLIAKLSNDYNFTVLVTKKNHRADRCVTRRGHYHLSQESKERLLKITDDELGKRVGVVNLITKIDSLMKGGYSIDFICASLDRTRSCILYQASKHNIDTTVKRDKSTPVKPAYTKNDMLTIYMGRPKSLIKSSERGAECV